MSHTRIIDALTHRKCCILLCEVTSASGTMREGGRASKAPRLSGADRDMQPGETDEYVLGHGPTPRRSRKAPGVGMQADPIEEKVHYPFRPIQGASCVSWQMQW